MVASQPCVSRAMTVRKQPSKEELLSGFSQLLVPVTNIVCLSIYDLSV